ncbi:CBO0543 family protein [Paenibacillus sp. LjRoot56]|uniref:CBO0543 family protein n=1 Tax=Paenibacillus sp. LjRoot56 TaxID=3342333 RepID=UPI003F4F9B83
MVAGAVIAIISLILDVVGVKLDLWTYHVCVIPIYIGLFPYDATLIPVIVMVLLYKFPKIHLVIKAVLFSTLTAYVGHPIFDNWLGFVSHIHWNNSYSIPI